MEHKLGKQIALARMAKGWSQNRLAAESKVSQSTIDRVEKDLLKTPSKYLPQITAALEGRPVELATLSSFREALAGLDVEKIETIKGEKSLLMPVYSSVQGGTGSLIISHTPLEWVGRPDNVISVESAFAVLVEGESMCPAYEPGDRAWVNPLMGFRRDTDAIFYSGDPEISHATIKRLVSWNDDHWNLRQHNPPKEFTLARKDWPTCYRVVGKFSRP